MQEKIGICLVVVFVRVLVIAAQTNEQDAAVLQSLRDIFQNEPPNWVGSDPCGSNWVGITCLNGRVIYITLSSMGLSGTLSGDIANLAELQTLDLSYNKGLTGTIPRSIGNLMKLSNFILVGCSFSGPIPDSIGSLQQLVFLSLNLNKFSGQIPASIGQLSKLYWLDLADNMLSGSIPVSNGSTPGLDWLVNTRHFHFGGNQLSGGIPAELFSSNMTLIHVLFESNQLTGSIPETLGLVQSLEVVRLDNNSLTGPVPGNLNNISSLSELYLSNNRLSGPLPNLTGMSSLTYVDMSNNLFIPSDVPSWLTSLSSLTTLIMKKTQMQGQLPADLFGLPVLQTLQLQNNFINGTLTISSGYSSQLKLVDLRGNRIDAFEGGSGYSFELILFDNPYCTESSVRIYCTIPTPPNNSYTTPTDNCFKPVCSFGQVSSPTCECAYPYTGYLYFRAPSFSDLSNVTIYDILHQSLVDTFGATKLSVDSVSLSNPKTNNDSYLQLYLQAFPAGKDRFDRTEITRLGFVLSNQTFMPNNDIFGPYFFIADPYQNFGDAPGNSSKSSSAGIVIGAAAGGVVLVILLLLAGLYALRQKRRAETADKKNDPFASWDINSHSGDVPQLKGAKAFSFQELRKYTNNFSETNYVGTGGYGKVYRGTLPNGQLVAIKRAQQGSVQGGLEFKTEIELLSRVHHRNVVALVGFCFDQGEQMLVYEYIPNGTLKDSLSGKSGIRLDWSRRLRIALGSARGLQYLHDLANPPIIHRDIKSNNILLDESLNAKVADFGLSKPIREPERGYVTTQVKGTMGYLDPEYYMTQQLNEKSDVYSFGVLLLELITARPPIDKGKYVVREVKLAIDETKDMYNLERVLDPVLGSSMPPPKSLERFVDLAVRCVEESGVNRPPMGDVVKEIETVMELAGLKSASTSTGYDVTSRAYAHPYSNESLFAFSAVYTPSQLEPK